MDMNTSQMDTMEETLMETPVTETKFDRIISSLQENDSVDIVKIDSEINFPESDGKWLHFVNVYVAPKTQEFYPPNLQNLMESLIPEIEPTMVDSFKERENEIKLGKLYFDETVGKNIKSIEVSDPHLLEMSRTQRETEMGYSEASENYSFDGNSIGRMINGKYSEKDELKRRILVRIYPNRDVAKAIINGKLDDYSLSFDRLRKYIKYRGRDMTTEFEKKILSKTK